MEQNEFSYVLTVCVISIENSGKQKQIPWE